MRPCASAAPSTSTPSSAWSCRSRRSGCSRRSTGSPLTISTGDSTTSVVATLDGDQTRAHDPAPRRHGRPPDARGHRASTSRHGSTAPCTPAATTSTPRCSSNAARLLAARRDELAGSVRFMFQPGEEGHHGARFMLEEGLLDAPADRPITGAFALHVFSVLPAGIDRPAGRPADGVGRPVPHHGARARAATPRRPTRRSTRCRSPARSSRRCRPS